MKSITPVNKIEFIPTESILPVSMVGSYPLVYEGEEEIKKKKRRDKRAEKRMSEDFDNFSDFFIFF